MRSVVSWFRKREWSVFVLLGALWLPALSRFSAEWRHVPQYYYGWSVPLFAAFLIHDRWPARPALAPDGDRHPLVTGICLLAIGFLALIQAPLRFFGEADYGWRALSWLMGLQMIAISLATLYLWGGFRWTRFFAFPFAFLAASIPWHFMMEQMTVQSLMRVNAAFAAGLVSLSGVPVEAAGNVIHVPQGALGIDEACSGIRSLQSTLSVSLFLAGLYRLNFWQGGLLAGAGVSIAFVCNVARTTFLTWQGAIHGVQATGRWHDTAGFAILGVVLVCLWFIARFLDCAEARRAAPVRL